MFESVFPSMPDTNSRLPTRMAELRFGFARPGLASAFGVADALLNDLARSLGGNAPKILGGALNDYHGADFGVGLIAARFSAEGHTVPAAHPIAAV